jgi:hypothetical protein
MIGRCILLFTAFAVSASAQLVYQLDTTPPTKLNPGSTVTFPTTLVSNQADIVIRVTNSGTANVTINTTTVSGVGFRLSSGPALPTTLLPTGSTTVTVTFAPTQAGPANGSILINSDTLLLSGVGLASPLVFSYVTAKGNVWQPPILLIVALAGILGAFFSALTRLHRVDHLPQALMSDTVLGLSGLHLVVYSIVPPVVGAIAAVVALTYIGVRILYHQRVRRGPAWDCGFAALDARMQDTAEGFGQPIRHIFGSFFTLQRELPTPFDRVPRYQIGRAHV